MTQAELQLVPELDTLDRLEALIRVLKKFRVDIEKALVYSGGSHTFDQVCARVLAGDVVLHELESSILLCEVYETTEGRCYHVYIACGNLDEIIEFQRMPLIRAARTAGCVKMSFSGRLGWVRALQDEGWKPLRTTMVIEI